MFGTTAKFALNLPMMVDSEVLIFVVAGLRWEEKTNQHRDHGCDRALGAAALTSERREP